MKVKYNDRQSFSLIEDYKYINSTHVRLIGKNALNNTSGFTVYNNNEVPLYTCNEYTVVYEANGSYVEYTSDQSTYYVFDIYNEDKYLTGQTINTTGSESRGILRAKGKGKEYQEATPAYEYYDEEGFFNYKVVEVENPETGIITLMITEVSEEEKEAWREEKKQKAFESALASKLAEISAACNATIEAGIDYGDKHFSYDNNDQKNIGNAVQMALATNLGVPYHADGESCEVYSKDDIVAIYVLEETNLTSNITYHNQLKLYVQTLETIEEIEAIKYGETELTGTYKETYDAMMAQAEEVIKKFIGEDAAAKVDEVLESADTDTDEAETEEAESEPTEEVEEEEESEPTEEE